MLYGIFESGACSLTARISLDTVTLGSFGVRLSNCHGIKKAINRLMASVSILSGAADLRKNAEVD